jgi:hypothetical protein
MILVYNDHTDADPKPVKVGDKVDLPALGVAKVSSINQGGRRAYLRVPGMSQPVLAPLHHLHARWVESPASAAPTLDQLHANLVEAHRAYFEALRGLIPKEVV